MSQKLFVVRLTGNVFELTLSTKWDLTTWSHTATLTTPTNVNRIRGIYVNATGTSMWITSDQSSTASPERVFRYNLSTAWDLSTASLVQTVSFAGHTAGHNFIQAISFKADGTELYLTCNITDFRTYTLSTAWDVSTATYQHTHSANTPTGTIGGIFPKEDGTRFYISATDDSRVYQYNLSTAWDFRTETQSGAGASVQSGGTSLQGNWLSLDGTKLFLARQGGAHDIKRFDLTTPWVLAGETVAQTEDISGTVSNPIGLWLQDENIASITDEALVSTNQLYLDTMARLVADTELLSSNQLYLDALRGLTYLADSELVGVNTLYFDTFGSVFGISDTELASLNALGLDTMSFRRYLADSALASVNALLLDTFTGVIKYGNVYWRWVLVRRGEGLYLVPVRQLGGWRGEPGVEEVSTRFRYTSSMERYLNTTIASAWDTNKNEPAATLKAALDAALGAGGFQDLKGNLIT